MATKKIINSSYTLQANAGAANVSIDAANLRVSSNAFLNYNLANVTPVIYFGSSDVNLVPAIRWSPANAAFQWSLRGNSTDPNNWVSIGGTYANGVTISSSGGIVTFDVIDITGAVLANSVLGGTYLLGDGSNTPLLTWNNQGVVYGNITPNSYVTSSRFYYDQANANTLYVPNISVANNITVNNDLTVAQDAVILGNLQVAGNTTFVDVTVDTISNAYIVLAANSNVISQANEGGFVIVTSNIGATPNITFQYSSVANAMILNYDQIIQSGLSVTGDIVGGNLRSNNNTYSTRYFYNDGANLVSGTAGEIQFSNSAARLTSNSGLLYDAVNSTLRANGTAAIGSTGTGFAVIANSLGIFSNSYSYANGVSIQDRTSIADTYIAFSNGNTLTGNAALAWDNSNSNINITGNILLNLPGNAVIASIAGLNLQSNSNSNINILPGSGNLRLAGNLQFTANGFYSVGSNTARANLIYGREANLTGNVLAGVYRYTDTGANITAGSNNQIQFNTANRFAASSSLTFNPTTNVFMVMGDVYANGFYFANGNPISTGGSSGISSPGAPNNSIQFNLQGTLAGAPGLSYELSSGNVVNQGNITAVDRSSDLVQYRLANVLAIVQDNITDSRGFTAPVWNSQGFFALEVPANSFSGNTARLDIANIAVSNVGVAYYANVRFSNTSGFFNAEALPVGSNVTVDNFTSNTAFNRSNLQVLSSGQGWANLSYTVAVPNITTPEGNVYTPAYVLYSPDAVNWSRATALRAGYSQNQPQRLLKRRNSDGLLYSVMYNSLTGSWDTWRSVDLGATWILGTAAANTITPVTDRVYDFSINDSNVLMLGSSSNDTYSDLKIAISTDFGNTYSDPVTTRPTASGSYGIVGISAGSGNSWLAVTRGGQEIYSTNQGVDWQLVQPSSPGSSLSTANVRDIATPVIFDSMANVWIWSKVNTSTATANINYLTLAAGNTAVTVTANIALGSSSDPRNSPVADLSSQAGRLLVLQTQSAAGLSNLWVYSNILASSSNVTYSANTLATGLAHDPTTGRVVFLQFPTGTAIASAVLLDSATGNVTASNVIANTAAISGSATVGATLTATALQANTANLTTLRVADTATLGNVRTDNLLYANGLPYAFSAVAGGSNLQLQYNLSGQLAGAALTYNPTANSFTLGGKIIVPGPANLDLSGGTAGQMLGYTTAGTLSFLDRVTQGNVGAGTNTPTGTQITAALPAGFVPVTGSLFLDTNSNPVNTQPLYIYLNNGWRQIMITGAL